jgi:hypothetical protein
MHIVNSVQKQRPFFGVVHSPLIPTIRRHILSADQLKSHTFLHPPGHPLEATKRLADPLVRAWLSACH